MPCLNEEGRIGVVVHSAHNALPSADIVVIDDASDDASAAEAIAAGATVLRHGCNLGYGATLETGYLYAISSGYDIALQMDGDGQHLAEELPRILAPLIEDQADIVVGSRYLANPKDHSSTLVRRAGQWLFRWVIVMLSGKWLSDPTSGFKGLNRRALSLFSSGVLPYDYPDSDVILMSFMAGLRISEVPARMKPRSGGKSMHSGLKPIYYGIKMFLSILIVLLNVRVWRKWRREHNSLNRTAS
jgi:glycosyltransferase involved in cell wall biosynthesis